MKFWLIVLCSGIPFSAFSDSLVTSMNQCGWDLYAQNIQKFQHHRELLPSEITVTFKSCAAAGPTYKVKSKNKVLVIQDDWLAGERSIQHLFSSNQPSSYFWQFEYQGYEWGGYQWIHKTSGKIKSSPGNSCNGIKFSPTGKKALFICEPEYGSDLIELYAVSFDDVIKITRLHKNFPIGEFTAQWNQEAEVTVMVGAANSKFPRRYKLK